MIRHDARFHQIRQKLIEMAKDRKLINYGYFIRGGYGVGRGQGNPGQIGTVLGDICEYENSMGHPLLSAICVLKSTGMPSSGFWDLQFIPQSIRNGSAEQKRRFWEAERDKVFNYWQRHDP